MLAKWKKSNIDLHLVLVLIMCALFVAYWTSFTFYRYVGFNNGYVDLGQQTYSLYLHLHYAYVIPGLQYLSFATHIDPFEVLLIPLFALSPNPIGFAFMQDVALALAAVVAYFIGRDVAKNRYFGLALAIAFLINPGVRGMVLFDVHPEAFIPLFFLLSFYFYMRGRRAYFLVCYAAMLSIIESVPAIGITLLVGLLLYEGLTYKRTDTKLGILERKKRIRSIFIAFLITLLFIAFYGYAVNSLISAYNNGAYGNMPTSIRVVNYPSIQFKALGNPGAVNYNHALYPYLLIMGLIVLLLGFGITSITSFRSILLSLVFISPWILQIVILHNLVFASLFNEYYAYVIGGALSAAVLGFMILEKEKRRFAGMNALDTLKFVSSVVIAISIIVSLLMLVEAPNPYPQTWHAAPNYSAMRDVLESIPPTSAVMAQPNLATHLYYALYLEVPPNFSTVGFTSTGFASMPISTFYTKPTYIVLDPDLKDFVYYYATGFNVYRYMNDNYTLYASAGDLKIYKLKSG